MRQPLEMLENKLSSMSQCLRLTLDVCDGSVALLSHGSSHGLRVAIWLFRPVEMPINGRLVNTQLRCDLCRLHPQPCQF